MSRTLFSDPRGFTTRFFRHPASDLFFILVAAIAFRAYAFGYLMLDPDSCQYLDLAREMVRGDYFRPGYDLDSGIFVSRRLMPVYPVLVAVVHLSGASLPLAGYIVSWLADLGSIAVAWNIGRRAAGRTGAALAALAIALSADQIDYANAALSEALFIFLTLSLCDATYAVIRSPGFRTGATTGVVSSLAYLTREIGFVYAPLLIAGWAAWLVAPGRSTRRSVAAVAAGFLLAFAFIAAPYWVSVKARTGNWQLSLREGVAKSIASPSSSDDIMAERGRMFLLYSRGMAGSVQGQAALALVVGMLFVGRKRKLAAAALIGAVGTAAAVALVGPTIFTERYLLPARALLLTAAAVAAAEGYGWLRLRFPDRRGAELAALLLIVGLSSWPGGVRAYRLHRVRHMQTAVQFDLGIRAVCEELRRRYPLPADPLVMDRKPFAAFWLEGRLARLPETVAGVDAEAAVIRPDLIVLDSVMIARLLPGLKPLLHGRMPPPGMRLIYQFFDSRLMKVYTVYGREDLPPSPTPEADVVGAGDILAAGDLFAARRALERLLQREPQNLKALDLMTSLEMFVATATFDLAPAEKRVAEMERIAPGDRLTMDARSNVTRLREQFVKAAP